MTQPRRGTDPATGPLPGVVLARDIGDDVARRESAAGRWVRLSRGVYLPRPARASAGRVLDHRREALARAVGLGRLLTADHWFSHETAALVWELPTWRAPRATHVLQRYSPGPRSDRRVVRHTALGEPEELTVHRGLPVTTLERTVVDCASTLPPLDALVVADAALRRGADLATIDGLLACRSGVRGVRRAREVMSCADAGAESPGESATRYVVLRAGFPRPRTQVPVPTRLGTRWADLGWPEWRLLLEYDGRTKYVDAETLVREKRRHDALVEAGNVVLRVTKEDLARGDLVARIVGALGPGRRPTLQPRRWLT